MGKRGRPPLGVRHVDKLEGDVVSKERLQIILRTLSGELGVDEACGELDVSEAQFYRLRERALQGALGALAPRPPGRPPAEPAAGASRVAELEAQLDELTIDLRAAQLREEIALVMPHLLKPRAGKKNERNRRKRQRKRRSGT